MSWSTNKSGKSVHTIIWAACISEHAMLQRDKATNTNVTRGTTSTTVSNVANSNLNQALDLDQKNEATISSKNITKKSLNTSDPQYIELHMQDPAYFSRAQQICETISNSAKHLSNDREMIGLYRETVISYLKENINFFNCQQIAAIAQAFAQFSYCGWNKEFIDLLKRSIIFYIQKPLSFNAEELKTISSAFTHFGCRDVSFMNTLKITIQCYIKSFSAIHKKC